MRLVAGSSRPAVVDAGGARHGAVLDLVDVLALGGLGEVVGHEGDVGVGHVGERLGDRVGGVVVQEAVPEPAVLPAGDEHADLGVAVGRGLGHHLEHRPVDAPVGALDDLERQADEAQAASTRRPARSALCSSVAMCTALRSSGVSVRAYWMARAELRSSCSTSTMHRVVAQDRGLGRLVGLVLELLLLRLVRRGSGAPAAHTMIGTRTMMNQAPWVNLVTAITTVTTPVATAPRPLMNRPEPPASAP